MSINTLNRKQAILAMNQAAAANEAFFFTIDFDVQNCIFILRKDLEKSGISFRIGTIKNENNSTPSKNLKPEIVASPPSYLQYKAGFDSVMQHLQFGNTYLTNFTCSTPIKTNIPAEEIFQRSQAKYKLFVPGHFLVFSPECFVKINKNGRIFSYPMKGTIDASIPDAAQKILSDSKEMAEHNTIVDLIRNDLSSIAEKVRVTKFRYIDELKTSSKTLLQVSSEISGQLPINWQENLGTLIFKLLPAGSISGAPKQKTIEIIREAEGTQRGFYTGVCGYFDGSTLDSGVMIRFIEMQHQNMIYRSGGGITINSDARKEYEEMKDKIYVPIS